MFLNGLQKSKEIDCALEESRIQGMDFQELLRKYMTWVIKCESVDFITEGGGFNNEMQHFTPDELAELKRLSAEIYDARG